MYLSELRLCEGNNAHIEHQIPLLQQLQGKGILQGEIDGKLLKKV